MSSAIPTTNCVYFFAKEFEQLQMRAKDPTENGLCCFLFGLWTHSSNIVVHLVVSNQEEHKYAKTHQLNCVGYVALEYTERLYKMVNQQNKISSERQHIIVDVNETMKSKSLQAFTSHPTVFHVRTDPISQGQRLQVNMLRNESPFRKGINKMNSPKENMNGKEIESETGNVYRGENQVQNSHGNAKRPKRGEDDSRMNGNEKNGHENAKRMNVHDYEYITFDPDSNLSRSVINKIKFELGLHDRDIGVESFQKSKLIFQFKHHGKHWRVELKPDEDGKSEVWVKIFSSQCSTTLDNQVYSQLVHRSKPVVTAIQELCHCETCKK